MTPDQDAALAKCRTTILEAIRELEFALPNCTVDVRCHGQAKYGQGRVTKDWDVVIDVCRSFSSPGLTPSP